MNSRGLFMTGHDNRNRILIVDGNVRVRSILLRYSAQRKNLILKPADAFLDMPPESWVIIHDQVNGLHTTKDRFEPPCPTSNISR